MRSLPANFEADFWGELLAKNDFQKFMKYFTAPTHSLHIATKPSPPRSCVAPPRARHTHKHPRLSASASHRPFLHRAAGATTFKPSRIFKVCCSLSSSSFESANPQQIFKARRRLVLSSSHFISASSPVHLCSFFVEARASVSPIFNARVLVSSFFVLQGKGFGSRSSRRPAFLFLSGFKLLIENLLIVLREFCINLYE
ncbi:hypothetical protein PIB30_034220 [Stylosanthes scabra]|uniref:Uncharacterized protein n=1 Tax=Stylosanthes scabra TaxID=79078 RepID=A0ABU6TDG4_9FABA|nr:hypothetical protein [Stylosanthes scabra]